MNEDLLQFIWQHKYLLHNQLKTVQGQPIEIIKPGLLNKDAGPDFFNAQIRIDKTLWAGNVEVHIKSSDWHKHGHQKDSAYHNVILHIVWENDEIVLNNQFEEIPTLEMKSLVQTETLQIYQELLLRKSIIPCEPIFSLPEIEIWQMWLERLSIERLEKKHALIVSKLKNCNGHWEEVLFKQIAIGFGQKINALPFELLTTNLPWNLLIKYQGQQTSFQALILGTAGFLGHTLHDQYNQSLQKEFHYLSKKHKLQIMDVSVWKFGKTRPANFPTIRLFQFAELVYSLPHLLQIIVGCRHYQDLLKIFDFKGTQMIAIGDLHPKGKDSHLERIFLSNNLTESLIINVIIPVVFSYGKFSQQESLCNKAIDWLQEVPPESNNIVSFWNKLGVSCKKAKETQALIQLKNYYCDQNKCLQCAIGNHLLKPKKLHYS